MISFHSFQTKNKDVPVIYVPGCSLFQETHNFPLSVMKIASKMKVGHGGGKLFNNNHNNNNNNNNWNELMEIFSIKSTGQQNDNQSGQFTLLKLFKFNF